MFLRGRGFFLDAADDSGQPLRQGHTALADSNQS
jgi:hypothetical protein